MPVFGLPLMLVGLAALPALAGIYWLRTRFRRQPVSSLLLWRSVVEAQGGGRKKSRFQTPLALLLELLVIAMLVVAATGPRVLRPGQTIAVTVVLDDSYSMTAVGSDGRTARERAAAWLEEELGRLPAYAVRLVAAGPEPRVLSGVATDWSGVEAALAEWGCASGYADLEAGLGLAGEISTPRARLLVLTDHARGGGAGASVIEAEQGVTQAGVEADGAGRAGGEGGGVEGRLRWVSVGEAAANVGIVNAVRSYDSGTGDALLVEVANRSAAAAAVELVLTRGPRVEAGQRMEAESGWAELDRRRLEIGASGIGRVRMRPTGVGDRVLGVEVVSSGDGLAADDRVVLMPAEERALPVSVEVGHARLAAAVRRAVVASGRAVEVSAGEALLQITDRPIARARPGVWVMRFETGGEGVESEAYLGPFVIDFNHPMSEGLTLAGGVWAVPMASSDEGGGRGGRAVVSTG
ncbi:MAG: BatA and WFA domain-containing protein, partial [Planctomycetota bacterium]